MFTHLACIPICAQDIMFYAPPEHAMFYPDLLNLMEDTGRAPTGPGGQPQDPETPTLAHHSTVSLPSAMLLLSPHEGQPRCTKGALAHNSVTNTFLSPPTHGGLVLNNAAACLHTKDRPVHIMCLP
eukprot:scaffold669_cov18-Tisochrysis_lutea.AAC.1